MMGTIRLEVTDTFAGEANYCWVYRKEIRENLSRRAIFREVRELAGWPVSIRLAVEDYGDQWIVRPRGLCQVAFVDFDWEGLADSSDDSASKEHQEGCS
jgi:predicted chitinase